MGHGGMKGSPLANMETRHLKGDGLVETIAFVISWALHNLVKTNLKIEIRLKD